MLINDAKTTISPQQLQPIVNRIVSESGIEHYRNA